MSEPMSQPVAAPHTIIIREAPRRGWIACFMFLMLGGSVLCNFVLAGLLFATVSEPSGKSDPPIELYHSGDEDAQQKIALIDISGTITPPFTERILDTIAHVEDDPDVKGVILVIDSPGGLVADSHQIYHRLKKLRDKRKLPVYVSMTRIAASGGYYVAMGAGPEGRIFAEPTTWTGSIGVIIPRYDLSKLASDFGVVSEPLTTGPYKDALSPFRELSAEERVVWEEILDEAFARFRGVIAEGRSRLTEEDIAGVATGRIFTADQAVAKGLVDQIGFLDDAIDALQTQIKIKRVRVVRYEHSLSLSELLFGGFQARQPANPLHDLLEAGVPRAMYYCGWNAGVE